MSQREISLPQTISDPYDVENVADLYKPRFGVWFEQPGIPENPLQALMETPPGDSPERSKEEIQAVREAVAECMVSLDPKDVFIINSKDVELLSYRQLGDRLGCSKSQAEREHKAAYKRLATILQSHPIIQERHPALKPTTWEEAAATAVARLQHLSASTLTLPFDEGIARGKQLLAAGWDNLPALNQLIQHLGASAFGALAIESASDNHAAEEVVSVLIDRHHKYGPNNIMEFTEYGLLIRMSDKVARIKNGSDDFEDETFRDAYIDMVGYAAIAYMLDNNLFLLPLNQKEA